MAGVEHGKSRRRLRKRIRWMRGQHMSAMCQYMENGPCCQQSEHSKTSGPERLAWQESHTENRGGGFAKESRGRNWQRRAQSKMTAARRIGVTSGFV